MDPSRSVTSRSILTGAVGAVLAGCALAAATPPTVEVARVGVRSANPLDQSLEVALCVTNPNDTALAFRRVRVAADVAGARLAESVSEVPVRLPPRSSVLVPFAVTTTTRNLGPQVLAVLGSGKLDYRLHGTVQLDGALALPLPFSRSGSLDLLSAGGGLLADAAAPAGTRCGVG